MNKISKATNTHLVRCNFTCKLFTGLVSILEGEGQSPSIRFA